MLLVGLLCPSAFAQTSHEFDVDEDRPFITDVSQLSSPWDAPHEWEGNQAHLLDGDPETYWHTNWNKNTEKHYLQVALNEPIHELIAMKVIRRHMNYNKTALCVADHVTKWGISGADSPDAEDSGWTELGMFDTPYNEPGETLITDAFDTKGKQYLRIYAEATNTGNRFWHAAELQLYPIVEIDEMTAALREASELFNRHLNELYYLQENVGTEPGQYEKEAVDAFAAAMDAVSALDEMGGTYTLEDVTTIIETLSNEAQNPLHFARNTNVVITYGRYGDTDGRRGCFFVETAGDVASDYAPNATRIRVWEGAMTARCYPVTMTAIDKELGQMWTVSGIEREAATDDTPAQLKVTLTRFADNTVPAGQPFIYVEGGDYIPVEERSEDDEPLLVDVTFGNDFVAEPQNSGALKGVFTRTTIGEGALNVGDTKFTITTSTAAAVDTNGAYIVDEEEVPRNYQVVAIFDDEGNGITETLQTLTRSTDVYTIDGRLVRKGGNLNSLCNAQPGIYIVGGVKVVVR